MAKNPQDVSVELEQTESVEPKRKSWLPKFRNKNAKQVEADLVLNGGQQLSTGEKVKRFLKSQNGWLFMAPALILMILFSFYPIVTAFINAFKNDLDMNGVYNGWGFDNFLHVFRGDTGMAGATFWQCLVNTLIFTLISVPLSTLLALLISVGLNSIKALQKAYQTILFLPYLTNSLAMGAVFATFFSVISTSSGTNWGIINNLFGTQINWIGGNGNPLTIGSIKLPLEKYFVLIVYEVWTGLPFKILILFSALQSINKQYYDAAKVDGASRSTILWKITAPMISPQISYLLVTGIMGGMKQYTAVVGLFGSEMGSGYDMGTMVGYIYRYVEGNPKYGYAYAASLLLFLIIMVITFFNNKITKRRTTYK